MTFKSDNTFGQSSCRTCLGQTNKVANDSFAQKPFGNMSPVGAQTASFSFGSTSTGVFGSQPSSPAFGVSSSPAVVASSSGFGAFGQLSSCKPFGSPSVFEQTNNADSHPLVAPKPFGNTSPVGAQTLSSTFGGTSTGKFGSQTSSQAFGVSSMPAFGPSSCPSVGDSSSTFGGFGKSSNSPFGSPSVFRQTYNADTDPFAPKPFVNTSPFDPKPSAPAFSASSMTASGAFSSPTFGASSSSFGGSTAFGCYDGSTAQSPFEDSFHRSQTAFGALSPQSFGSLFPAFGAAYTPESTVFGISSGPAFGSSSLPAFSSSNTPAFGATSTPAFGSTLTPTFGESGSAFGVSNSSGFGSSTPAFGASSIPAFAASSSSFSFAPSPSFGQSSSPFKRSLFSFVPPAFRARNCPFGEGQETTPAFRSPGFGETSFASQRKGSRVTPYAQTPEKEFIGGLWSLESISAMPVYKEKSHEELRWEDYQAVAKGQSTSTSWSSDRTGTASNKFPSPYTYAPAFYGIPTNPFAPRTSNNTKQQHSNIFSSSPAFGQQRENTLGVTLSFNPFGSTPSPSQPSPFRSTPTFGSTTSSLFGSSNVSSSSFSISLNFGSTQPSPFFNSTAHSLFGQTTSNFFQTAPTYGQSNAFREDPLSRNSLLQITINNLTTPFNSVPFQSPQLPRMTFGTPMDVCRVSVDRVGTALSVQYGDEQSTVVKISVPTNESPSLILEIEKLKNLRI